MLLADALKDAGLINQEQVEAAYAANQHFPLDKIDARKCIEYCTIFFHYMDKGEEPIACHILAAMGMTSREATTEALRITINNFGGVIKRKVWARDDPIFNEFMQKRAVAVMLQGIKK